MIEKAIHEILDSETEADAVDLRSLLSADSIVTGNVKDPDENLPYATFNLESNQSAFRSNQSNVRRPLLRFKLWAEDHSEGISIRDALKALFENKSFETPHANLIMVRHENDFAFEEEDGVWQFVVDFTARITGGNCGSN